jgi:hypothetical protein
MGCKCGSKGSSSGCGCSGKTSLVKYASQLKWDGGAFECDDKINIPECANVRDVIAAILNAVCCKDCQEQSSFDILSPYDDFSDIPVNTEFFVLGNFIGEPSQTKWFPVQVDRVNCFQPIVIEIFDVPVDYTVVFTSTGTTTMSLGPYQSFSALGFIVNGAPNLNPPPFKLRWTACGVEKIQTVNFII